MQILIGGCSAVEPKYNKNLTKGYREEIGGLWNWVLYCMVGARGIWGDGNYGIKAKQQTTPQIL